jgi:predicted RNA-binding protein with PUA-like domain
VDDRRYVVVDVSPRYLLSRPVTLKEVKQTPFFADWQLVTQSRLSVMPVPKEYWDLIHQMSNRG